MHACMHHVERQRDADNEMFAVIKYFIIARAHTHTHTHTSTHSHTQELEEQFKVEMGKIMKIFTGVFLCKRGSEKDRGKEGRGGEER